MDNYVIVTDSSCDMSAEMANALNICVAPLSVNMDGTEYLNYLDWHEIAPEVFYNNLRNGSMAKTSAVNTHRFIEAMEPILKAGSDILYLGFTSGLSATYSAGVAAANELLEKYPDRKIYTVDTLCASLGQGLIVYLTAKEKEKGATIEEARDFAESIKMNICHWVTVDDLHFLHRGGRVSSTVAVVGSIVKLKPILIVDNEGRLEKVSVARGRKASISHLYKKAKETGIDIASQTIFISHGDCAEDAESLANMLRADGAEVFVNYIGPVIGAHSGPGTIALFFIGTKREN